MVRCAVLRLAARRQSLLCHFRARQSLELEFRPVAKRQACTDCAHQFFIIRRSFWKSCMGTRSRQLDDLAKKRQTDGEGQDTDAFRALCSSYWIPNIVVDWPVVLVTGLKGVRSSFRGKWARSYLSHLEYVTHTINHATLVKNSPGLEFYFAI